MAKFLITGDPGSGKSALAGLLARRGYIAYDTDDLPDVTRLEDPAGRPVDWPEPPVDWSRYSWNWQEAGLRERLASAETVFVAATVSNQGKYYSGATRSSCSWLTLPSCASVSSTGTATAGIPPSSPEF